MGIGSLGNRLNRAPQFAVVPGRDAMQTVVDGNVFDGLHAHVRDNSLVSGICQIDHDGVRLERRNADVLIKAPASGNEPLTVCVKVNSFINLVFEVGSDGLVSRRTRIQKRQGEKTGSVGHVRREEALSVLRDVANGFRANTATADDSAEDNDSETGDVGNREVEAA